MRLGIVDLPNLASDSQVTQDITLPLGATSIILSFMYWPQYDAAPGAGDLQFLNITNLYNGQFIAQPLGIQGNNRAWLFSQYDLTAQAGQQIRLNFGVRNDGIDGRTAMWLDNVSIHICTGSPTPSPTTTPAATLLPTLTPTFVPTLTPTPLPTVPSGCVNSDLINGSMEVDGFWVFGDVPVPGQFVGAPPAPQGGLRSARLGIAPELGESVRQRLSFSSMRQLVSIPATATTANLRWWHWYRTEEPVSENPQGSSGNSTACQPVVDPCGNCVVPPQCQGVNFGQDRQELLILDTNLKPLQIVQRVRRNENGWVQEQTDLTAYRGQTFYIYFNAFNDGNGIRTWAFYDDIELNVCYPPPTPTAPPTPTSVATLTPTPSATPMMLIEPPAVDPGPIVTAAVSDLSKGADPWVEVLLETPLATLPPLKTPSPTPTGAEESSVRSSVSLGEPAQTLRPAPSGNPAGWANWLLTAGVMSGLLGLIGLIIYGVTRIFRR
jgi:hypothetical protein